MAISIGRMPKGDPMKLKVDENGKPVYVDGLPVYINDEGKEHPFDAKKTVETITRLNTEARDNRIRAETAEAALAPFKGIDPEKTKKALALLDSGEGDPKKVAEQIERIRKETSDAFQAKVDAEKARADKAEAAHADALIGTAFAGSKFIAEASHIPASIARGTFGSNYKVVDGRIVALAADGQPIFSQRNPGAPADFEESLEILYNKHPDREKILKSSQKPGGGAGPGTGGGSGKETKNLTRKEFEDLTPMGKSEFLSKGGTIDKST